MTEGNRPTKQQRTGTARIISRPRETTTLPHLGSSIQEALKISACENTSTCLHASRNQLFLSPNLDAAGDQGQAKSEGLSKDEDAVHRAQEASTFSFPQSIHLASSIQPPFCLSDTFYPRTLLFLANSFLQRYGGIDLLVCKNPQTDDLEHRLFLLHLHVYCGTSRRFYSPVARNTKTRNPNRSLSVLLLRQGTEERTWREAIRRHKTPISVTFSSKELSRCQSC